MIRTPAPLAVLAVAGHLLAPVAGQAQQVPRVASEAEAPELCGQIDHDAHCMGGGLRIRIPGSRGG